MSPRIREEAEERAPSSNFVRRGDPGVKRRSPRDLGIERDATWEDIRVATLAPAFPAPPGHATTWRVHGSFVHLAAVFRLARQLL
jgi:hypothetical protein